MLVVTGPEKTQKNIYGYELSSKGPTPHTTISSPPMRDKQRGTYGNSCRSNKTTAKTKPWQDSSTKQQNTKININPHNSRSFQN
jgi:hypothetical protein